ncbi:hypothetical protein [Pedobacter sp. Leaf194]|uniref:hypothetical protein n=1 Tax=Pedobacter sp. Leaf194 TaxID=1736297 RepID=UPI0007037997|nr:hypothetical protein [Pedobacter sp. Leaf194]KQS36902.1 hypothetical protein ASG14_07670 [Pedobacter sp. Leaf194]
MVYQKYKKTKTKNEHLDKTSEIRNLKKARASDFLPEQLKELFDNSERKIGEHERILLSLLVEIIVEITIKEEL